MTSGFDVSSQEMAVQDHLEMRCSAQPQTREGLFYNKYSQRGYLFP